MTSSLSKSRVRNRLAGFDRGDTGGVLGVPLLGFGEEHGAFAVVPGHLFGDFFGVRRCLAGGVLGSDTLPLGERFGEDGPEKGGGSRGNKSSV